MLGGCFAFHRFDEDGVGVVVPEDEDVLGASARCIGEAAGLIACDRVSCGFVDRCIHLVGSLGGRFLCALPILSDLLHVAFDCCVGFW